MATGVTVESMMLLQVSSRNSITNMLVISLLISLFVVYGFPESGDPITEEPALIRPKTPASKVVIFADVACNSWDLILTSNYTPPLSSNKWSRVILDVSVIIIILYFYLFNNSVFRIMEYLVTLQAKENGTQFDRYGAFWLGNVEILRTTTAEPTSDGIVWKVEKDITSYLDWLMMEHIAYLSIPNNIDSTYTGIPLVNISLTFYESDANNPPAQDLPELFPLSNSPGDWNAIEVSNGSNLTYSVLLPYNDVVGVTLELMASAHSCEEFWYTNIDDNEKASKYGLCGGGVYRELQVYVDGLLAGATYPFPVMYTGGINPFLWRPLTGIMSFDIPAYSFDLSPFVLGDGREHEVTVKVLGGDAQGGMWYLDSALMLYHEASMAPVTGGLVHHADWGSNVTDTAGMTEGGYGWNTTGNHEYHVQGSLTLARGTSSETTIALTTSGALRSWNTNLMTDDASVEVTDGALSAVHVDALSSVITLVQRRDSSRAVRSESFYPYRIVSSYKQDATTMDMRANVNMSYVRSNTYLGTPTTAGTYNVSWRNSILSNAAYNRSLDHSVVYIESDNAAAGYAVLSDGRKCYQRAVAASEGFVVTDLQQGACRLPRGQYICGYELCTGDIKGADISPLTGAGWDDTLRLPAAVEPLSHGRRSNAKDTFLVRSPRKGRTHFLDKN